MWRWVGMRVPSIRTTSPPCRTIFLHVRSRRGALQMLPQQTGEVVDGARGQRQTALVDKRAGALGVLFGSLRTEPNGRRGHRGYVRAAPFQAALVGLAPSADASQQVRGAASSS
ncbi:hypothetical protein IQ64_26490 [Streptomyces stelliscabiei]|nr:hypothetical protein IQ64_26490 [Streptomyces stelliscabiei]